MTMSVTERKRFWILVIIVSISGFSQGMLLPLISSIFERDGVSSVLNGLTATGLYIGTLVISPFIEAPLRRYGYKPIIVIGGIIVFLSLFLFPLWKSAFFWFVLRLFIGIGDHAIHFSTQTWITSFSHPSILGKNIAIYGLSFGVGFAIGPMMVPLVHIFEGLPFIISGLLCMFAWSLVFRLKNEFPEGLVGDLSDGKFTERFRKTMLFAWVAFLGPFGYGFLESSLNAMYPVYALRNGFALTTVSFLLTTFALGGVISQLPLGILSDRIGRKPVFVTSLGGGAVAFGIASMVEVFEVGLFISFFVAGLFAGSLFSLGISYMSELVPQSLLPTGNLLCGMFFSVGSLTGPFAGGLFLERDANFSFLLLIAGSLAIIFVLVLFGKGHPKERFG